MDMVLKPESNNIIDYIWSSHPMPWFCDCGDIIKSSRTRDSIYVIVKINKQKMISCENRIDTGSIATIYDCLGIPLMCELIPDDRFDEDKFVMGIRNHG